MRAMVSMKTDDASEAGAMPDEKTLTEMERFDEEMTKAGFLPVGEGLHPSRAEAFEYTFQAWYAA